MVVRKMASLSANVIITSVLLVTLLSGCVAPYSTEKSHAQIKQSMSVLPSKIMPTTTNDREESSVRDDKAELSHLAQCKRDLESLRRISPSEYARYRDEYDALMSSSASFMAVSGDISDEVSDLARPRFQFALVNLCYRIKNALAQTLISQAGGEGAR